MQTRADVTIIGAGPAGLCLARALSGRGLKVVLVERQSITALQSPAFDGREIALTHRSRATMQRLGLWSHLDAQDVSPLRDALVINGRAAPPMRITHRDTAAEALGYLVSNQRIRAVAWAAVDAAMQAHGDITLIDGCAVEAIDTDETEARVVLQDGTRVDSKLLVAADSRFSQTRRALGIRTRQYDFGRSMLVCRVTHEAPHADTAWEWFDRGQTLALLPLGNQAPVGHRSSVVLTLPPADMRTLEAMNDGAFALAIAQRFHGRLGTVSEVGERHVYPLVGTYPDRFVATRLALVGDAAVGMHPVTAHGFNFGLDSVDALANEVLRTHERGSDIGAAPPLARYDRIHRRATLPLYLATRGIVALYGNDRPSALALRGALLGVARRATPFRRWLAARLADAQSGPPGALPDPPTWVGGGSRRP